MGTYQFNHVCEVTFKKAEGEKICSVSDFKVKHIRCRIIDPVNKDTRLKLYWLLDFVPEDEDSTGLRRRIVAAGAAPRIRRTATTRAEKKSSKFPELGGVFHGEARTTEILPAGTVAQDNEEWVHGSDTIVPDYPDWLRVFLSGSHRSLQDGRGEASSQGGVATGLGIHGNGDQGDSSGRSSAVIDQRGVEQEMELIRAKEKLVRLELELERLRVENRPRSSASGAELSLREEVLSFSRLMKGVLTQMPSSELLVPSWFDGVENVFQTYEVPERLRGSLIRPYFTERMRALVNRLPVGEASEYGAVKERVLLELKMSPAEYRRLFLNATRAERESWTQFVTRVESCVEYYARSRSVESLEDLLALIVSDRVRDSMPVDMQEYFDVEDGFKDDAIDDLPNDLKDHVWDDIEDGLYDGVRDNVWDDDENDA
ncbi:hypothetical protein ISCGN_019647 [Ixodes scapularis]